MGNQQNQGNRPQQPVRDNQQQQDKSAPGRTDRSSQQNISPDKRDSSRSGNRMNE